MLGIYIGGTMASSNSNVISYFLRHVPSFLDDEVVFIDKFKINKAERHCSCEVVKYDGKQFLDTTQDWKSYDEHAKKFLTDNGINKLIMLKIPYSNGFMNDDDRTLRSFISSDNGKIGMSFVSIRNQLEAFAFARAAAEVCDYVYQYVIDPNEVTLGDYFKFKNFEKLYYLDRSGCKFAPYWCYGLVNDDGVVSSEKTDDFMFYCTAEGDNRKWLRDIADDVENNCSLDINIIRKGSRKKVTRRKVVGQELYFFLLGSARFTAVVPSYCPTTFSWMRFMEAVYCGCLPLVFESCDLTEVRSTFPDVCGIIESSLLVKDFYDCERIVKQMSESERESIICDIAACDSLEVVTDIENIRKQWAKIGGFDEDRI